MDKKHIKKIIEDYNFACLIAKRYNEYVLSSLYELYDAFGYHSYNFDNGNNHERFDMKIGNLILTYNRECGGIEKIVQVLTSNDTWEETTIDNLRKVYNEE